MPVISPVFVVKDLRLTRSCSPPDMLRDVSLDFTAVDFETANSFRSSVCSIGMVRVRDGQVVATFDRLVCPPQGPDAFTLTWVHGIGPADVRHAPTWQQLLPEVVTFIGADVLVAHNASFDGSVLQRASAEYGLTVDGLRFACTLLIARQLLALGSYSLPFVVAELGLPPFEHHSAGADALSAAMVALELARLAGVDDIPSLAALSAGRTGGRPGRPARHVMATVADWLSVARHEALEGERVCFTGTLRTMNRPTAQDLVVSLGGQTDQSVTKRTTVLVSGDLDPRRFRPGATMSTKLARAFRLAEAGQPLRVMSEAEFLQLVDITPVEVAVVKDRALSGPS